MDELTRRTLLSDGCRWIVDGSNRGGRANRRTDTATATSRTWRHRPRFAQSRAAPPESRSAGATNHGTLPNLRFSFSDSHVRQESGGWTRQVTVRELGISKGIAGVNMRLNAGGVRELHWHKAAEWAYMLYGTARITAIDPQGQNFVDDVGVGDLWYFPSGVPHSIQGLNPDGCELLVSTMANSTKIIPSC
jgi:oxalate decarboxylase